MEINYSESGILSYTQLRLYEKIPHIQRAADRWRNEQSLFRGFRQDVLKNTREFEYKREFIDILY